MRSRSTAAELAPSDALEPSPRSEEPSVGRSSFYFAMRLLPGAQRIAMFEIYRFCRAVDDVADGDASRDAKLAELARWRSDIDALFAGTPPNRVRNLLQPVRAFALELDDFHSIIDGMEMDVRTTIRAPDLATLDLYCDRVACAVGRLSVRVFGMPADKGTALANALGRALQLTNILRDLDDDATRGRLYLPREALLAAGIERSDPGAVLGDPALDAACSILAQRARSHFDAAHSLMRGEPIRATFAPRVMAGTYRHILRRLVERRWAPPRRPIRVGVCTHLWIVLRHGLLNPTFIHARSRCAPL